MNIRPFVIDATLQAALARLRAYAETNPISTFDLVRGMPIGANANHVLEVAFGYRIVFSIEEQPELGKCRHLSMSVDERGKLPNLVVVQEVAKMIGFECRALQCC